MKKFIVPQGCAPPPDNEIKKIVENLKFCAECNYRFTDFDFIYQMKKNPDFILCEPCLNSNEKLYKESNFEKVNS